MKMKFKTALLAVSLMVLLPIVAYATGTTFTASQISSARNAVNNSANRFIARFNAVNNTMRNQQAALEKLIDRQEKQAHKAADKLVRLLATTGDYESIGPDILDDVLNRVLNGHLSSDFVKNSQGEWVLKDSDADEKARGERKGSFQTAMESLARKQAVALRKQINPLIEVDPVATGENPIEARFRMFDAWERLTSGDWLSGNGAVSNALRDSWVEFNIRHSNPRDASCNLANCFFCRTPSEFEENCEPTWIDEEWDGMGNPTPVFEITPPCGRCVECRAAFLANAPCVCKTDGDSGFILCPNYDNNRPGNPCAMTPSECDKCEGARIIPCSKCTD
jgi:hypothetical protein